MKQRRGHNEAAMRRQNTDRRSVRRQTAAPSEDRPPQHQRTDRRSARRQTAAASDPARVAGEIQDLIFVGGIVQEAHASFYALVVEVREGIVEDEERLF